MGTCDLFSSSIVQHFKVICTEVHLLVLDTLIVLECFIALLCSTIAIPVKSPGGQDWAWNLRLQYLLTWLLSAPFLTVQLRCWNHLLNNSYFRDEYFEDTSDPCSSVRTDLAVNHRLMFSGQLWTYICQSFTFKRFLSLIFKVLCMTGQKSSSCWNKTIALLLSANPVSPLQKQTGLTWHRFFFWPFFNIVIFQ